MSTYGARGRPLCGLGQVLRLQRPGDAVRVRRVGLVAVLGQPDPLRPEVPLHLTDQLVEVGQAEHAGAEAAHAPREPGRRLAARDRIGMVRVRIEPRAGGFHPPHERDRREPAARRARRGRAPGDTVGGVERVQLDVRRVEQPLHVELRRVRLQERLQVRLVPDLPQPQPRIALGDGCREGGQRVLARRHRVLAEPAVGPRRRADERREHRDPVRVERSERRVDGCPVVGRVAGVRGVARLPRRDLPPVDHVPDEADPELVERLQPGLERRPAREVGVVLEPELDERRGRRAGGDGQREDEDGERELHALIVAAAGKRCCKDPCIGQLL